MKLAGCEDNGWLSQEDPSRDDILTCLCEAESDLMDARRDMGSAWSFSLSCSAVLHLCAALLKASGCQSDGQASHHVVNVLPMVLGENKKADADYLASCMQLRSQKQLQDAHSIASHQATELFYFTENLYLQVTDWLRSWDPLLLTNRETLLQHDTDWLTSL